MATSTLDRPKSPPPASRKAHPKPSRSAPKAPPPPPQYDALGALCAALGALIVAHRANATSRPVLVVLDALQGVLVLARLFSHEGGGLSLATGPNLAGLAWHPAHREPPSPPSSPPSSSTTRSTTPPGLGPFQRRVCGSLADALDHWADADQLAAHLVLAVHTLAADRTSLALSNIDEIASDLRDALFALAGSLCEASHEATGLPAQCPPMAHAIRLHELLDLDDEEHRDLRRRQVLTDARKAFEGTAA